MIHYQNVCLCSASANFCTRRYKTSLAHSLAENVNVLSINVKVVAVLNEHFLPAFESFFWHLRKIYES